MNVLIYNGPGAAPRAVAQVLHVLKLCLGRFYDVKTIDERGVKEEPWESGCALFVMPGGRDLPYVEGLAGLGSTRIRRWVGEQGGKYAGFCAGAYYASDAIEFDRGGPLEVCGPRPLGFFPGKAIGPVFGPYVYGNSAGASVVRLRDATGALVSSYFDGGCHFESPPAAVQVLATYADADDKAAVVLAPFGNGLALLAGPHLEYDPELLVAGDVKPEIIAQLRHDNPGRHGFLMHCLRSLGLLTAVAQAESPDTANRRVSPLRLYKEAPGIPDWIPPEGHIPGGAVDFFLGTAPGEDFELDQAAGQYPVYVAQDLGDLATGMSFVPAAYFGALQSRTLGRLLLYAERIMSTHVLLRDNQALVDRLPNGTVLLAGDQLAGKGRGSNVWLSSTGCLQFTCILDHPSTTNLSIIQYLVALAMAEIIGSLPGCDRGRVRLKWPNDVYAQIGDGGELKKVGGVLVTSVMGRDQSFRLLVSFGINIYDTPWSLCVRDLARDEASGLLVTKEAVLARFMATFEDLHARLCAGAGFPYELYYKHWLHNRQIVYLEEEQMKVCIEGIDEYGYLRARAIDEGLHGLVCPKASAAKTFLLQPDGNSFDMMRKLIHRKA